mmetsp:Transcript_14346/g.32628  ORF Transcript_14346/g.32628 Transcript_14346/m.32628 type:complete len:309 (+) Transcript_14346:274-1200(+)
MRSTRSACRRGMWRWAPLGRRRMRGLRGRQRAEMQENAECIVVAASTAEVGRAPDRCGGEIGEDVIDSTIRSPMVGIVEVRRQLLDRPRALAGIKVAEQDNCVARLGLRSDDLEQGQCSGIWPTPSAGADCQWPMKVHEEDSPATTMLHPHPLRSALAIVLDHLVLGHPALAFSEKRPDALPVGHAERCGVEHGSELNDLVRATDARIVQHPMPILALLEAHEVIRPPRSCARYELSGGIALRPLVPLHRLPLVEIPPPLEIVREHLHLHRGTKVLEIPKRGERAVPANHATFGPSPRGWRDRWHHGW